MSVDKFNHEGYFDLTTYEALTNIHREEMAADKKAAYLPLVYVCSPYAGDVENNVANAKKYSRCLMQNFAVLMRFTSLFTGRQSHQYMLLTITLD